MGKVKDFLLLMEQVFVERPEVQTIEELKQVLSSQGDAAYIPLLSGWKTVRDLREFVVSSLNGG